MPLAGLSQRVLNCRPVVGCRLQNCNDRPWTSSYPVALDSADFAPGFAAPLGVRNAQSGQDLTPRAQRSIRMLSEELPEKLTLQVTRCRPLASVVFSAAAERPSMLQQDMKACKLDTRCELADQFVDDLVAAARAHGGARAKAAAAVLERWDRRADADSVGTLIFLHWATNAGATGSGIGGFAVPLDDRRPLDTPRGFADPARAVAALEDVAAEMERTYGTLEVKWGDALRFPPVRANAGVPRLRCLRASPKPLLARMSVGSRPRMAAPRCPATERPAPSARSGPSATPPSATASRSRSTATPGCE